MLYYKQKQFNKILIKFKKLLLYIQQQIDQLFCFYRQFFRIFMNNIMIFSYILKKHLFYLQQIFELFQFKRVNLIFINFFLNYSSIILFNQRIDNFNLFTLTKKIVVITLLRFSKNLKNLNYFLNFIE